VATYGRTKTRPIAAIVGAGAITNGVSLVVLGRGDPGDVPSWMGRIGAPEPRLRPGGSWDVCGLGARVGW